MADNLTAEQRKKNMQNIKSKDKVCRGYIKKFDETTFDRCCK